MARVGVPEKKKEKDFFGKPIGSVIQIPQNLPSREFADNSLWIKMEAKKFERQSVYARGDNSIQVATTPDMTFKFLAPMQLAENIGHEYGSYDSIASRLMEKIGSFDKLVSDVKVTYRGVGQAITGNFQSALGTLKSQNVLQHKVDTSLVYQGTQRREYTFSFLLADQGDIRNDVLYPIKLLEKFSCAEQLGENIHIQFPYVFTVTTTFGERKIPIIDMKYAVITAVQPTYQGPYRDGYPTFAECQVTFTELDPLYNHMIEGADIIRIEDPEPTL